MNRHRQAAEVLVWGVWGGSKGEDLLVNDMTKPRYQSLLVHQHEWN